MPKKRIGFIGLGKMGKPMAKNIIKGGFSLTVYDLLTESINELVTFGAVAAKSPKEVGENSQIAILMVPDSPEVEAAVLGKDGLLEGMREGNTIVVMSTVDPFFVQSLASKCAKKGVRVIDAGVAGSPLNTVAAGTATIMAGGPKEIFDECRDVFETMGKYIFHCGDVIGSGEMAKLANNIIVLTTKLIIHEAMVLGLNLALRLIYCLKYLRMVQREAGPLVTFGAQEFSKEILLPVLIWIWL